MCEIKIENNGKMLAAMQIIKDVMCENPKLIADVLADIEHGKLEYVGYSLAPIVKQVLCTALTTMQVLQDCESIQLNFGEGE